MAGKGSGKSWWDRQRHNVAATPNFEPYAKAADEDALRARMLRARAERYPALAAELRALANEIDPARNDEPTSCASSRYMRSQRVAIFSPLWRLHDELTASGGRADPTVFHAIPQNWSVPLGQLHTQDPRKLMGRFRSHLNRANEDGVDGVLFAAVHGAYDPTTQTYGLHVHGWASGCMITVVDALRNQPTYTPAVPFDGRDRANTPILIEREPLKNLPDPITYTLKSYWTLRETELGADGVRRAVQSRVKRLLEPAHSEYLLWMARWRADARARFPARQLQADGRNSCVAGNLCTQSRRRRDGGRRLRQTIAATGPHLAQRTRDGVTLRSPIRCTPNTALPVPFGSAASCMDFERDLGVTRP